MKILNITKVLTLALGLAFAFSPARAQTTTDSYTAVGTGIYSGTWDTPANWSAGSTPDDTSDVQFSNSYAYSNWLANGGYPYSAKFTLSGGSEDVGSLWFNTIGNSNTSYYYSSDNSWTITNSNVTVDGTDPVAGYTGFVWGVVDGDDNFTPGYNINAVIFNNTTNGTAQVGSNGTTEAPGADQATNTLTFANSKTAISGDIEANFVATQPTTLLVTNVPSLLGGQIRVSNSGADANQGFSSTTITVNNDLTDITTLEVTVNGGTDSVGIGGEAGVDFTIASTGNYSATNVILAGGALNNGSYVPEVLGTLELGVGTNYLKGSYNSTAASFSFTSLVGATEGSADNYTPVSGAILAVNALNESEGPSITIGGMGTGNNINGIVGGWAIDFNTDGSNNDKNFYGADWGSFTSTGAIVPLAASGYTYDEGTGGLSDGGPSVTAGSWNSTMNIDLGTDEPNPAGTGTTAITVDDTLTGPTTINSLRFGVASAVNNSTYYMLGATLDVAGNQLVINTGGILQASGLSGTDVANPAVIQGAGSITAGADNDYNLYIYPGVAGTTSSTGAGDNTPGYHGDFPSMIITAAITDNDTSGTNEPVSVTVSSSLGTNGFFGNVYLYGDNSYTGNTYLVGPGAASIDASNGLGLGGQVVFNGGTLYVNAAISSFGHQIVVDGGDGGTIDIEPIGTSSTSGSSADGDVITSGLVLTNQGAGGAITGSGPLTIQSDGGTADGMVLSTSPAKPQSIVDINGQSTLTGPLVLENQEATNNILDVFLDNTGAGYALNSDTYLAPSNGAVFLTWEANDQVNPTAVINVGTNSTKTDIYAYMQLSGYSDTIGGLIETNIDGGVGILESNGDAGVSTLTLDTLFRPDVYEGVYEYDGTISGTAGTGSGAETAADTSGVIDIIKTGSATEELNGNNTYTGTTTVNAGTLLVNGTHTGGNNYIVNGGGDPSNPTAAILGGYGSIVLASSTNTFTVSGTPTNPGIIYPGPNGLAALTAGTGGSPAGTYNGNSGTPVAGEQNIDLTLGSGGGASAPPGISTNVNFGANSELKLDLGSNGLSSQLYVYGNITIANLTTTTLVLNIVPGSTLSGTYILAVTDAGYNPYVYTPLSDGDALGTITGAFANVIVTGGSNGDTIADYGYQVDYNTDSGEILLDAAVPEPSVMAMMVGALGLLVFVIRRRKNGSA